MIAEVWKLCPGSVCQEALVSHLTEPDRNWEAMKELQANRHRITHLDTLPDEDTMRTVTGYIFDVFGGRVDGTFRWES